MCAIYKRIRRREYCSSDVTLLRKCALKFWDDFTNLSGLDLLKRVIIAAACQKYFNTFLIKRDKIRIISTLGYQPNRKTRIQPTQWLKWKNMSESSRIQRGREKKDVRIVRYFVDWMDVQTKTVYEYNGCVFYWHPEYNGIWSCSFGNLTMKEAYGAWEERKKNPQGHGYSGEVKWSCEWLENRKDSNIHQFLTNLSLRNSLGPKEGFFWRPD